MRWFLTALTLLILVQPPVAEAQEPEKRPDADYRAFTSQAITGYIRPAISRFADRAKALQTATAEGCSADVQIRKAFSDLVVAWSGISLLRFGPLITDNRADRIHFWPDRKGTGLRQLQRALAKRDPALTNSAGLADQSVALQGLGALEFLLYGLPAESDATSTDYRCQAIQAISGNLANIGRELVADWNDPKGHAHLLQSPGPDNPVYRAAFEPANEILGSITAAIQSLAQLKLNHLVPQDGGKVQPKNVAFWRSHLARLSMAADFTALDQYIDRSGLTALLPQADQPMMRALPLEFGNAQRSIARLERPVTEAVTVDEDQIQLNYLRLIVEGLYTLLAGQAAPAAGLGVAFTALDGD